MLLVTITRDALHLSLSVTLRVPWPYHYSAHVCCQCSSVYKSPQYESMGFRLVVDRLVAIGYPEAIREFEYDHSFPVRSVVCHCASVCLSLFACVDTVAPTCKQLSPSVLWYCWLGLLTCKNRLPYNLYCVGGDVKQCSVQHPVCMSGRWFLFGVCLPELNTGRTLKDGLWEEVPPPPY